MRNGRENFRQYKRILWEINGGETWVCLVDNSLVGFLDGTSHSFLPKKHYGYFDCDIYVIWMIESVLRKSNKPWESLVG
jgi:hypothetical protein